MNPDAQPVSVREFMAEALMLACWDEAESWSKEAGCDGGWEICNNHNLEKIQPPLKSMPICALPAVQGGR